MSRVKALVFVIILYMSDNSLELFAVCWSVQPSLAEGEVSFEISREIPHRWNQLNFQP